MSADTICSKIRHRPSETDYNSKFEAMVRLSPGEKVSCPIKMRSGSSGISRNNLWERLKDINLQLDAVATALWVTSGIQKKPTVSFSSGWPTFLSKIVVFNLTNNYYINRVNVMKYLKIYNHHIITSIISYQASYFIFYFRIFYLPICLPILCNRITWQFSSFKEEMLTKWKAKRKCMQCHYILRC